MSNHPYAHQHPSEPAQAQTASGSGAHGPFRPSLDPDRVMDDPRFASLSYEDQVTLLGMSLDQQWNIGWGPYPEVVGAGPQHGPGTVAGGYGAAAGEWQADGQEQQAQNGVMYDPMAMPDFLFLHIEQKSECPPITSR